jgi:DNA modification methylase
MQLWSNPGDVVLSPFMGIGSEGVVSLQMGRKFVGFELKPEYFQVSVKNLRNEERKAGQPKLFDDSELLSV